MNDALGNNWVLLRGLARESAHWGDFVAKLQALLPAATVTALDLPGTGRHCHEQSPRSIRAIAEAVRQDALELGLPKQPLTVLALSLGGMVAWEWLQTYPDEIAGAVLLNTSFGSLNPFYERMRWQVFGKFMAFMRERDLTKREMIFLGLLNNNQDINEKLLANWVAIQEQRPVRKKTMFNQMLAAAFYSPKSTKPAMPVLLLNSTGDLLVAPSCSETIQQKWALPLKTHPWAGHDMTADDGEWVLAQIQDWLAELQP
jgi:pimeloyl-ACP methyl ester carboxylesterase